MQRAVAHANPNRTLLIFRQCPHVRTGDAILLIELAELSAKQWLRELEAADDLPASTSEWQTLTAKASFWLAKRVNVLSLTTEFATT